MTWPTDSGGVISSLSVEGETKFKEFWPTTIQSSVIFQSGMYLKLAFRIAPWVKVQVRWETERITELISVMVIILSILVIFCFIINIVVVIIIIVIDTNVIMAVMLLI